MTAQITKLNLHKASKTLSITFANGKFVNVEHELSAEYLRVQSPSAQVTQHGNPQLQVGKKDVGIDRMEPVGNYGIKIFFSDGHDTGIFTWAYLIQLCEEKAIRWENYIKALHDANESRTANTQVVNLRNA